jgi:D-tyrosyl-tRNA(Tyr) deacylase
MKLGYPGPLGSGYFFARSQNSRAHGFFCIFGLTKLKRMRVIIQRVSEARVEIEGRVHGEIGPGLMVLLGITHDDTEQDIQWMVKKLLQLRIFRDAEDKMNLSVQDVGGGILVVSQFTLYAQSKKGNRPSYIRSAPPAVSVPLYERFLEVLRAEFSGPVATGEFGADMRVHLVNEGPVTIMIDSREPDF